ncbi:F-box/kelch-repeat protein At3g06240-like [Tripterygium wilfordii]|uniref:F-box/kelch-repeat protein At3g06240-like n=1 Tax=Tripterygium wilfordii TaxID=458696 RepID=UPI0018F82DBA|nr:F-box/kelch-repeat protein At3g06240-like [Tripterygium wilfordii]
MHLGLGFGYDASFNHKIVRIAYPSIKTHPGFPAKVGLYDLSKDNWRSIDAGPLIPYFISDFSPQAFTHGAIHWIAFTCNDSIHDKLPNLIMLFDMENEVFKEMEVPDILGKEHEYNLSVGAYDDTVCVMQYNQWSRDGWNKGSHCSIWVMKEYGESKSWVKQFNIDLGMHKVVCFRGNGEAVVALNDGKLASYDLNRKRISDLGITGNRSYFFAGAYVESLFLLLTRG